MYTFGKLTPISCHKQKNALVEKPTMLSQCSFTREIKEAVALPLAPAIEPCTQLVASQPQSCAGRRRLPHLL